MLKVADKVAVIKIGMRRREVEEKLQNQDGGASGPGSTRYYEGWEVMVEVPYDQTGGRWKPKNRVNGPVRIYRSRPHAD